MSDDWPEDMVYKFLTPDATEAMRKLWEQQNAKLGDMMRKSFDANRERIVRETDAQILGQFNANAPHFTGESLEYVTHDEPPAKANEAAAGALIAECVEAAGWWVPYLEAQR